jgi:hypothetical protein
VWSILDARADIPYVVSEDSAREEKIGPMVEKYAKGV